MVSSQPLQPPYQKRCDHCHNAPWRTEGADASKPADAHAGAGGFAQTQCRWCQFRQSQPKGWGVAPSRYTLLPRVEPVGRVLAIGENVTSDWMNAYAGYADPPPGDHAIYADIDTVDWTVAVLMQGTKAYHLTRMTDRVCEHSKPKGITSTVISQLDRHEPYRQTPTSRVLSITGTEVIDLKNTAYAHQRFQSDAGCCATRYPHHSWS